MKKLIIVHYHLRPGGVRRVIELATPYLVRQAGIQAQAVVLATGERADPKWRDLFRRQLAGASLELFIEPSFRYCSEQSIDSGRMQMTLRAALDRLLAGADSANTLVWMHNPGLGRNLLLVRELTRGCAARRVPLVMHHHDWWFDNRWLRWPEMRRFGFSTLSSAARTIFCDAPVIRHAAINRSDAERLQRHFSKRAAWMPNLMERATPPTRGVQRARGWLKSKLNDRSGPVWILPCRFLRRKNIAEALLLTRWLRPEAWLVTTGGPSSADEQFYFDKLTTAARRQGWQFRPAVLQGDEASQPAVSELLAASEVVLLTSLQEGFGLPYLEAAAAGRPLIARVIPNVAPDLQQFGFRFPQYYHEVLVDPALFDWTSERKRQRHLFETWRHQLPPAVRCLAGEPPLLASGARPCPVPFSRLTLSAQLEILAQPIELSWELCVPQNPHLPLWRKRAEQRRLQTTLWPTRSDRWLKGEAYARRFASLLSASSKSPGKEAIGHLCQKEFLRETLHTRQLFPLLWGIET